MIVALDKAILKRLYITEQKSLRDIERLSCYSREAVRLKCKQFGIPLRPRNRKLEIDKPTLHRLYVKEKKTFTEIAGMFNCAVSTISNRARGHGLQRQKGGVECR